MKGVVANGTRQSSLADGTSRRKASDWYWAEMIHECRFEGHRTSHVWVNMHLLRATNPERAFIKAMSLGRQHNSTYRNASGMRVTWRFRGLRELLPILAPMKDGAEILFESHTRLTERGVAKMVKRKHRLGAFRDC